MEDKEQRWWVVVPWMTFYVVFVIVVVSLPVLLAVVGVALIPAIGELRAGVTPWSLLHVLWILPLQYLVSTVCEIAIKVLNRGFSLPDRAGTVVQVGLEWLALTLAFLVFFTHIAGAAVAGLVALPLFIGLRALLERNNSQPQ